MIEIISDKGCSFATLQDFFKWLMKQENIENIQFNGELQGKQVEEYCILNADAELLLQQVFAKMKFSARSYHKILKVARTIADMDGAET